MCSFELHEYTESESGDGVLHGEVYVHILLRSSAGKTRPFFIEMFKNKNLLVAVLL